MDVEHSAGAFASANEAHKNKKDVAPSVDEDRSIGHGENDVLGGEKVDAVLAAKMVMVNDVSSQCEMRRVALCQWTRVKQGDFRATSRPSMRSASPRTIGSCSV